MKFKMIMFVSMLLLVILAIGAVSASDENITSDNLAIDETSNIDVSKEEIEVLSANEGTFSDLYSAIESTSIGNVLELNKDYKNTDSHDVIPISKSITIDGKNHKIDANSKSGIFYITGDNVILKNINFVNAAHMACNVEGSMCSIINCSFDKCSDFNSDIDESIDGGVITMESGSIINCSFTNCVKNVKNDIYGGVLSIQNCDVVGCSFDNCCYGCNLVYGGAIAVSNSRIRDCSFSNCGNKCDLIYGGAINGDADIVNCSFSHCGDNGITVYGTAFEGGGTVVNCTFSDCGVGSYEPYGGDVHFTGPGNISNCVFMSLSGVCCNYDCIGNVNNCTFVGCSRNAVSFYCKGGNVNNCTFKDCNSAPTIFIDDYHAINIIDCTFTNCSSNENGGAIYNCAHDFEFFKDIEEPDEYINGHGLKVVGCIFEKCSAKKYGGAIYSEDKSEASITSCIFKNCNALYGGAIFLGDGADVRVTVSYFENNNAKKSGGAIVGGIIFDCILNKNSKPEIVSSNNFAQIVPDEITSDDDGIISLKFPSDAEGTVTIFIDDVYYDVVNIVKGIAKIDLSAFNGKFILTFEYSGDDNYNSFSKNSLGIILVIPTKIIAKDVKVLYSAGQKYKITVYESEDFIANDVYVVIKSNGKSFKKIKTNPKGVASFKVTQVPGTYKLTITSLNKTVKKTLTVKHLVTLKAVKVKKSAKKLVLQATLAKVNKKYLKNKKITFKFNGKTYKAKTNKKGVAKYTLKSKVLKKLKVGKKVTYQATYLKDTVKKTTKVKK